MAGPVRLGAFATAAAGLVPRALATLPPRYRVTLREGTTPALTRALRAGTLDLAVLALSPPFRAPDAQAPALALTTISERELVLGVAATHPFAGARAVEVEQLADQVWVASRSDAGDSLLGVWPGLPGRPDVRYVVRDWLAKLQIVAAGLAITTIAPVTLDVLPPASGGRRARRTARDPPRRARARGPGRWMLQRPAWPMRCSPRGAGERLLADGLRGVAADRRRGREAHLADHRLGLGLGRPGIAQTGSGSSQARSPFLALKTSPARRPASASSGACCSIGMCLEQWM